MITGHISSDFNGRQAKMALYGGFTVNVFSKYIDVACKRSEKHTKRLYGELSDNQSTAACGHGHRSCSDTFRKAQHVLVAKCYKDPFKDDEMGKACSTHSCEGGFSSGVGVLSLTRVFGGRRNLKTTKKLICKYPHAVRGSKSAHGIGVFSDMIHQACVTCLQHFLTLKGRGLSVLCNDSFRTAL